MENENGIKKLFAQAVKLEVVTTTISTYTKPAQWENTYEGDLKFSKAFVEVVASNNDAVVNIYVTEDRSGWMYRHEISHTDFIKCFSLEVLDKALPKFVSVLFKHSSGFGKDASHTFKTAEAQVYNAHDDGQFYWKNLIAQESAVAQAKAKAEALAQEILNGKSEASDTRLD